MWREFIQPLDSLWLKRVQQQSPRVEHLFSQYHEQSIVPSKSIVLLGVQPLENPLESFAYKVREVLYGYAPFMNGLRIFDMGNIIEGNSAQDTNIAIQEVLGSLLCQQHIVIFLSSHPLQLIGQHRAYRATENAVRWGYVAAQQGIEEQTLANLITDTDTENFSWLAAQGFLMPPMLTEVLASRRYDIARVGKMREHILETEPYTRTLDMLAFDLNAIRFSDAPGQKHPSPNGLMGDEACAVARLAGMADDFSSIGFYGYETAEDLRSITAKQVAQMIWFFVEGIALRRRDYPIVDEADFYMYTVPVEAVEEALVFLKSKRSERWWMKVPYEEKGMQKHVLVPCTYKDYTTAISQELPERWMRAIVKLSYF